MVAGSTTSRSPSRSPPPVATAEELRQLNSTLRSRLARSVTDLQAALVSRDAALYDARQAEVVRLRGEIAAYQDTENPNLPLSPTVVNSPESSQAPPAKRRVAPLSPDAGGSSGSAEGDSSNPVDLTHDDEPHADNGAVSDDGGHADDSGSEASHQSSTKKGSAADYDNDDDACDEDTAEVSDELLKAQTLKALAQSRSAERRRWQASPRHGPKVAGSRASPDGSDDSDSNEDPAPRSSSRAGSSAKLPASSRRRPSEPSGPMSPVAPLGPEELCIPGRAQARRMIQKNVDPWLANQISDLAMVTMLVNHLFPVLPTKPGWLFPRVDPSKRQQYTAADYCADLISEANVRALLDAAPWKVFEGTETAISFETDVGG
ncbi:hypothetical protein PF011_g20848 [Phytophthora fragariae]|uniref:Uncharacterized protein n=1 Tax=Phytophthora fragariae TaxID=53985 RepID=A0A6A3IMU6_9STRA|nr:hypothetical protein PF011_g20848 [Phytophthora fragariae]